MIMKKRKKLDRHGVLDFLRQQKESVIRRDIARAFQLKGPERIELKALLGELLKEGLLEKRGKRYHVKSAMEYATLEITGMDHDGELLATPLTWPEDQDSPTIYVRTTRKSHELGQGARFYARLYPLGEHNTFEAEVIRSADKEHETFVGAFYPLKIGGIIHPVDRKDRNEYIVSAEHVGDAKEGDLVEAVLLGLPRRRQAEAKILTVLGNINDPKGASLIAIKRHEIPDQFREGSLKTAEKAEVPPLGDREDLRDLPLVTIDDEDARDFDDAVWAEPDPDVKNPNGWHLVVAIADVSYYVTPGSDLDQDAYERGNSVYFPDRVVPMLPEALSNEVCSLKPDVDRACVAVHMWIDKSGKLLRHRFAHGLMRSCARLTYTQVQAAHEGRTTNLEPDFIKKVIQPLFGAYDSLKKSRSFRAPLEIESDEMRVHFGTDGSVETLSTRPRYDSHRLIEEMMILANVAAAVTLTDKSKPTMFRVHDVPQPDKVDILREYVKNLKIRLPKNEILKPNNFNHIMKKASDTPYDRGVRELVLRSQSQAVYSPQNIGHYGLNLARYCHFTSPIRRYADLLVHRALLTLPKGAKKTTYPYDTEKLYLLGEHISNTERRAALAERETFGRYLSGFLGKRIGETFTGRINGMARSAIFITLVDFGADGFLPLRSLGMDYFTFNEKRQQVVGRRTKKVFNLGDTLDVVIRETDPLTGRVVLSIPHTSREKRTPRGRKKKR